MTIERLAVPLRGLLLLLFAGTLFLEVITTVLQIKGQPETGPDAGLPVPLWALLLVELILVQVIIVSVWKLLDLVLRNAIFSARAFKWVDLILWCVGVGTALIFGLLLTVYVLARLNPGAEWADPGPGMIVLIIGIGASVVFLIIAVMRALLVQATELRSELDEVI